MLQIKLSRAHFVLTLLDSVVNYRQFCFQLFSICITIIMMSLPIEFDAKKVTCYDFL